MGSLFKSETKAVADPGAMEAFNLAKPYYQQGLSGLGGLANEVNANPAYSGQRVAGLNPFQTAAATNLGSFTNASAGLPQSFLTVGQNNLNAGANAGMNAQSVYDRASMDPTQMILGQAAMYANNPYVDGMINAASRDTVRQLTEDTLPSLARGFSGTGNTNSTRAGVESAIAQRGAQDRLADISTGIRSQFFGQGLNMAQNQFNQNLQNMLAANQGLQQASGFGADLINAGQSVAGTNFNQGLAAGGLYQNQNQAELDAQKAAFDEALANRLGVNQALVGSAAQTKTQTSAGVATQPSLASQLGSLALGAAGAWKAFSDIRMKQNIKLIGALASGLLVYEYEYKPEFKDMAGHGTFIGVMAQEAKQKFPEAVFVHETGYYAVDYSKLS